MYERLVKYSLLLSMTAVLFSGCGANIKSVTPFPKIDRQRVVSKNYTIGNQVYANVGDPILQVQDFYIKKTPQPAMQASDDFRITKGPGLHEGRKEDYYPVVGAILDRGKNYKIIRLDLRAYRDGAGVGKCFGTFGILIDDNGSVCKRSMDLDGTSDYKMFVIGSINVDPPQLRFLPVNRESVDVAKGYTNYEILYQGCGADSIHMTYREYSPDDLARTGFYQNLTYERKADIIVFRRIRIKVHEATSEGITYTILSDGESGQSP